MVEFGEKIKQLREEKGVTQQTMAEHLFVTRQAVSRWECGARYPDLLTTKKIADYLEVSIDELVSGEEMKQSVEKQQVLNTPISVVIQIILYTIGFVGGGIAVYNDIEYYAINGIGILGSSFILCLKDLLVLAAFAIGIIHSVCNRLSPKRTGLINSIMYAAQIMIIIVQLHSNSQMGRNFLPYVFVMELLMYMIAIVITLRYYFAPKYKSPVPVYISSVLLMFCLAGRLRGAVSYYQFELYRKNAGVGAVQFIGIITLIASIGLLIYQTHILAKKRRVAIMQEVGSDI